MRGFIGLCLLVTGLSIGAYSHYPGPAHREASLAELTHIITGAIHPDAKLGTFNSDANAAPLTRARDLSTKNAAHKREPLAERRWFATAKVLAATLDSKSNTAARPRVAKHSNSQQRVLTGQRPVTVIAKQNPAPPTAVIHGWRTAVVAVKTTAAVTRDERKSLRPRTRAEHWKLAKAIQRELKRVGCYWGKIDGVWGKGSKAAMANFMQSVNATLPTLEPDYIQLQLIASHTNQICGRTDDSTQVAARAAPNNAQPRPAAAPQRWRTRVASIETGALRARTRTAAVKRRPAPLPGRMSVGVLPRDGRPVLLAPPQRIRRQAVSSDHPTAPATERKRLKISALPDLATGEDQPHLQSDAGVADQDPQPKRPQTKRAVIDPFVAEAPTAAQIRRARTLRKAVVKKRKKRRRYRRYRRRSLQAMFMHPLGRR